MKKLYLCDSKKKSRMEKSINLSENIILIDAEYLDKTVGGLSDFIERQSGKRLPKADLCMWASCVLLDAGVRGNENNTQIVIIHDEQTKTFSHIVPSVFADEMNRKAFTDSLGECTLNEFSAPSYVEKEHFLLDSLSHIAETQEVKRIIVAADDETYGDKLREIAGEISEKEVTLLSMTPMMPGKYRHDILGFSLLKALGVNADEL